MSTIMKTFVNLIVTLVMGIISVLGMLMGFALWNNGLGDKFEKKTRKLFKQQD